jgi:hypothetical protein
MQNFAFLGMFRLLNNPMAQILTTKIIGMTTISEAIIDALLDC